MKLAWILVVCVGAAGGCVHVNSGPRIDEAAGLVEQRLGHKPAWTAPWDDQPPAWDGRSVLLLQEAVTTALRSNRELRADLEMIAQADADLVQAGLLTNPTLNFMIMFPSGGGRSMLRGSGLPMQQLQDLWMIPARQEVARAALQETILRVADRAIVTAADVKKVYARLQYTQRAIELIRENMEIVDQSTRIIETRQAAGRASQVQVNLSRIRHLGLRSELMAVEAEHRAAQRELLALMGFAAASDGWQVEPIHETQTQVDSPGTEEELVRLATVQRLDLKAAEWQVLAAEHEIELMQLEAWPELALGLGFERMAAPPSQNQRLAGRFGNALAQNLLDRAWGMPTEPGPPMIEPFGPKTREMKYTVGPMIEMELPIFDQNQAQIARAVHMHRQRLAQYESRFQEAVRMVRESLVMRRQAGEQVDFYRREMLPEVGRNVDLARQSYIAGQEDLTVYLQSQEGLLMTRLRALQFLRDCLVRQAELERAAGGRLTPIDFGDSYEPEPATQPAEQGHS
ncbi:MAG: TolC family protein, partial [Planctomycetes bacterium]|nr:TolC family protein [Planctomycetota bacterium]